MYNTQYFDSFLNAHTFDPFNLFINILKDSIATVLEIKYLENLQK